MSHAPLNVIIVGGGVSGLGTALALTRAGHQITVIERDNTPMPDSADEAFEWDRRGAPQVRHSHAFLARLRNLLLNDYPDVYDYFPEGERGTWCPSIRAQSDYTLGFAS